MKIRYERGVKPSAKREIDNIKIGTVFGGQIGNINSTFLKTFGNIVDLKNPHNTWGDNPGCVVDDYKELNAEVVVIS